MLELQTLVRIQQLTWLHGLGLIHQTRQSCTSEGTGLLWGASIELELATNGINPRHSGERAIAGWRKLAEWVLLVHTKKIREAYRPLTPSGPVRNSCRKPNTGLLLGLSAWQTSEQSPCSDTTHVEEQSTINIDTPFPGQTRCLFAYS